MPDKALVATRGRSPVTTSFDPETYADHYPFPAPAWSYLLTREEIYSLRPMLGHGVGHFTFEDRGHEADLLDAYLKAHGHDLVEARFRVVASASNRNPHHLAARFRGLAGSSVPVIRGWLWGADVAYPAHIAPYGVVTSTLVHSPGTKVDVHVLFLDREQLLALHEIERVGENFDFVALTENVVELENGGTVVGAYAYLGRHGVAVFGDGPRRLARVTAEAPRLAPASLAEIMANVAARAEAAGLPVRSVSELQAHARRSEADREEIRSLLRATSVGSGISAGASTLPVSADRCLELPTVRHNSPTVRPDSSMSIRSAEGCAGSPGIVMSSPQSATSHPAPV
jgi:hypothetical protein